MEILTSEIQKNSEIITKIKRSKKYTRYLENKEEKNAFLSELRSLKIYRKKLRL